MRIRKLQVDGLRAFGEREFDFAAADQAEPATLVAITGAPASGKTTLLDAIIAAKEDVGSYGTARHDEDLVAPGQDAAKIHATWWLSEVEREQFHGAEAMRQSETLIGSTVPAPPHDAVLEALLSRYDADGQSGTVEYFHAHRRFPFGEEADLSRRAGDVLDRRARLATSNAKFANLVRFIVASGMGLPSAPGGGDGPEPGRVTRAFAALCGTKRLGGLYQEGDALLPGFLDAHGSAYGLGQLSDSEQEALLFATTFVRAGLVDNAAGALVLVDTPERHLGPAAGAFLKALQGLGPHNQIIVATQSPQVLEVAGVVITLGMGA